MANRYHDLEVEGSVHIPNDLVYANQVGRLAASSLTSIHVGRLAKQVDDNSYWVCTGVSPVTWAVFTPPKPVVGDIAKVLEVESDGAGGVRVTWAAPSGGAHDLGGALHNADTLANLNTKVSDATLDDSSATRTAAAHALGSAQHSSDTLANLNAKVSDATLDDSSDTRTPSAHDLGGAEHGADTLANLNLKVSDATLDDSSDTRTPSAHDLGGAEHGADTLANLNLKVSDATLDDSGDPRTPTAHAASHEAGADGVDPASQVSASGSSGQVLTKGAGTAIDWATTGDVVGPASATDGTPAIWDGTTGKLLKDSPATSVPIDTAGGGSGAEGVLSWDATAHTLNVPTNVSGVTNQVGQEDHDQVWNATGVQIDDFTPVYLTGGITSGFRNVAPSDADASGASVDARSVFGIMTHDCPDGAQCIVTPRGILNGVDTSSWAPGTELWLDTTAGGKTSTKPLLSSSQIRLGIVITQHATTGVFAVNVQDLSWSGGVISSNQANERTGFVLTDGVPTDLVGNPLTFTGDDTTRTFTIDSVLGSFAFFSINNLFVKSTPQSIVWTDVEGNHYFWYDATGTLIHSTTFDESIIYGPEVFAGYLYWDQPNQEIILDGPIIEGHGHQMSGATHVYLHNTLGAQWRSGLTLGSLSVDQAGNTDSDAQFSVASGAIADEDLYHAIGAVGSTAGLRILYLDGASELTRQTTETGFSVLTDTTAGVGATGRLVYNEWTGSAWQLTAVATGDFVLCHVFAVGTDDTSQQVYAAIGQDTYGNVAAARAGAATELANLTIKLPFPELRPLATVVFQTSVAYSNSVKARVRSVDDGDYVDQRNSGAAGGTGFTSSEHSALSGRADPDSHPATAVSVDAAAFTGLLTGETEVQSSLATLDTNLDQDVKASASPTFGGLTLSGTSFINGSAVHTFPIQIYSDQAFVFGSGNNSALKHIASVNQLRLGVPTGNKTFSIRNISDLSSATDYPNATQPALAVHGTTPARYGIQFHDETNYNLESLYGSIAFNDPDLTAALPLNAGAAAITTTAQDIVGAINELKRRAVTTVSSATYTVLAADSVLKLDCRSTAIVVTIPSALIAIDGWYLDVKDWYYNCTTLNRSITFETEGAELIDLETNAVGSADGFAWRFISDVSNLGVF